MTIALILRQTHASGLLLPALFTQALGVLAKVAPAGPIATMHGQELRVVHALGVDDNACVGFVLDFAGQGERVEGSAQGLGEVAFVWAFHAIAAAVKCTLEEDGVPIAPAPDTHRAAALAYLDAYEADVQEGRAEHLEIEVAAFVAWLAREEHLALAPGVTLADLADLPLDDAPALYEQLLEHDSVDEVFVSERELTRLLSRFKARARPSV